MSQLSKWVVFCSSHPVYIYIYICFETDTASSINSLFERQRHPNLVNSLFSQVLVVEKIIRYYR